MPWQNVGLLEASWEAAFGAQPVDVESIVTTVPAKADRAATNEVAGESHSPVTDPVWAASYTDSATCKAVGAFGSRLPA
jgi:hypothetical protein